ncbi:MAG: cytochrome c-type biogenesis CcmF C-terminal domain-containing protein [Chloroflexota bacterium]
MADIGYIALVLALLASVFSVITYILGRTERYRGLIESARKSLLIACGLVSLSILILLLALLTHNFQLEYVASYTGLETPLPYLFSALWAGHSGSLLFWAWLVSIFALIVVLRQHDGDEESMPYAASIMMFIEVFFLIMILSVANPFNKLPFTPEAGTGLNPLLENPGMIFHPPALLAGYAGLTVPFALAMAALLVKRHDSDWLVPVRQWLLLSWLLLGIGNVIGAWWAYVELGWGGYWAWDPVENSGLMPWLIATAALHSTMMQKRRGMFRVWNISLIILAFVLPIFGTYLTRSGILSTVHTFPNTGAGPLLLLFLAIIIIGSIVVVSNRRKELSSDAEITDLVSRDSTFLFNNLLLFGSTIAILLGTIFPIIFGVLRGVEITVGPSFFNIVSGPLFLAIILLAGVCALIGWQRSTAARLGRKLLWPSIAAVILGLVLFIVGIREVYALIAFFLCSFVLFAILYQWSGEVRARCQARKENYLKAFWSLLLDNRPRYGGYLVHLALVLMAVGVVGSSLFDVSKEVTLKQGESVTLKNYTLTYDSLNHYQSGSKFIVTASLSVYNSGRYIGRVAPEKYFQENFDQAVTEVAIRSTPAEDLYVILAGWDESGVGFKILVNPLVQWIWIGGGLLAFGGVLAYWPGQRGERKLPPRITGRACPRCGENYQPGDRFCPYCGVKLPKEGVAEPEPETSVAEGKD